MEMQDLNALRSVDELANYQKDVRSRMTELHAEHHGLPFPDEARDEFADLKDTDKEIDARVEELQARNRDIERLAQSPRNVERVGQDIDRSTRMSGKEADIYDLSALNRGFDGRGAAQELRSRAMRAVEAARFPHTDRAAAQEKASKTLDQDNERGDIAMRILLTGGPVYARSFGKYLAGVPLSNEESRALSLASAGGGYAVPFTLDPTIIPTSNGTVNPLRAMSRVVQITNDEWRGVSSGAITVAYAAEATETTDNSPTLAQPVISTEKAQAFIPFSIEIDMDWPTLQAEMGRLLQEGKDDLEAVKFVTGGGTNEPFGVITGATNTVNATTGQTFDVEDLYRLEATLPARYRSRAAFLSNRAIYNLIRQFTLTGQSNPWKDLDQATTVDGRVGNLLGYPAFESTGMTGTTATGVKFLMLGDFSRFVIVDRIGLNVELIPHLFGTAANYPTGQRGLYAYFRNGSKVVDANAFRVLIGLA